MTFTLFVKMSSTLGRVFSNIFKRDVHSGWQSLFQSEVTKSKVLDLSYVFKKKVFFFLLSIKSY